MAALALVGCGGAAEGLRVGAPETSVGPAKGSAPRKGKVVAESSPELSERRVDVAALSALPFPVEAPDATAAAAELEALQKGPSSKSNWVPPGRSERWGHAAVLVRAPLDAVRVQATDYAHLKDFAPNKFKTSRVVDKNGSLTDVYLQIPVLHGLITLWQVVRFAPPEVVAPGMEVIHGMLVKGNVKDLRFVVTLRATSADATIVKVDILLEPGFYAPQSALDEELRDAAQDAVEAVRVRSERPAR